MKKLVNNWYNISVYLAAATALAAVLLPVGIVQRLLLISVSILFVHFFEEFGWPGGFPWLGVRVMLGSNETDSSKWDCNNLNSMFGNWCFLVLVYVLPIFLPALRFLTLGAMIFNLLELFMHVVLFNARLKSRYNPGMVTAVLLTPVSLFYFLRVFESSAFAWYDYVLAVVWFIAVFWFCFRSPLYWKLGRKPGYPLTSQTAFGVEASHE